MHNSFPHPITTTLRAIILIPLTPKFRATTYMQEFIPPLQQVRQIPTPTTLRTLILTLFTPKHLKFYTLQIFTRIAIESIPIPIYYTTFPIIRTTHTFSHFPTQHLSTHLNNWNRSYKCRSIHSKASNTFILNRNNWLFTRHIPILIKSILFYMSFYSPTIHKSF